MDSIAWQATLTLGDDAATNRLGARLAGALRVGDWVALSGNLGAGKSSLARAIIRSFAGEDIEVPSPTFTLVQDYPDLPVPVVHYDLYRIVSEDELAEIGFSDASDSVAVLIEWPEHAGRLLPHTALRITLSTAGNGRLATFSGDVSWRERLRSLVFSKNGTK